MLDTANHSDLSPRDRFLERVATQGRAFAVSGEQGLARVASQNQYGHESTLLWSSRAEAESWAPLVATNSRIKELSLNALVVDVLPGLAKLDRYVSVDWGRDTQAPDFDPSDLAERLRLASLDAFVRRAKAEGRVWTLEDTYGPAMLVSQIRSGQLYLPAWAERDAAEARIEGPWHQMEIMEIPLTYFIEQKLTWLAENGFLVGPDPIGGAATLELTPEDLRARFVT